MASSSLATRLRPDRTYIWAATTGEMPWRLLRLIPVMTAVGPDITRSACGRLAGEIALIPTAFRHATWTPGDHPGTAAAA